MEWVQNALKTKDLITIDLITKGLSDKRSIETKGLKKPKKKPNDKLLSLL